MSTHGASLPGRTPPGQDRWAATSHGLIVLDGATAIDPALPPAEEYVDALLAALCRRVDSAEDLGGLIADAIATVTNELALAPGDAPSSTVAVLRWTADTAETAVLGDSTIMLGTSAGDTIRLCDDRLAAIAAPLRRAYRERLRDGHGYDDVHRKLLVDIQRDERRARNTEGGYWIAEADSHAGHHADVRRYPLTDLEWAVLTTDGAQRVIDHLDISWLNVAAKSDRELADLLRDLHQWEAEHDPDGQQLPRAKRHDDKTLAAWTPDQR